MTNFVLPTQGFYDCFGCSPNNERGLKLKIWYSDEGCFAYYKIPENLCGFTGVAHGGIIASLLDEIAAWTIITQLFRVGVTLELTIRYLKLVPTNEEITIKGRILEENGKNISVKTSIYSTNEGTLLAEANSKWLLPKYSTIARTLEINESQFEKTMIEFITPLKNYILRHKSKNQQKNMSH